MESNSRSLSKGLWDGQQELARQCLHHPFVRGILTGDIPEESFRYYVSQDALYLRSFARAYLLAAARCPDWNGFCTFHELAGGALRELELHESYAERWDVAQSELQPAASTRQYTDFLLATAWGTDTGTTAAAMAPCMRLYAYLGRSLMAEAGRLPDHQYAEWIETYADNEFEALASTLEQLVDRYVTDEASARSAYRYAMQCELAFFEAAHRCAR